MSLLRLLPRSALLQSRQPILHRTFLTSRPLFSEAPISHVEPQPSVLSTLQPELKKAMRAKDKPRLSVIRSLLADISNASKTDTPVSTDQYFYRLLKNHIKTSNASMESFTDAKREDLVEMEKLQLNVLEELVGKIDLLGEAEIEKATREVAAQLKEEGKGLKDDGTGGKKLVYGMVLGKTMAKIGPKPVDVTLVQSVVQRVVEE
jgi:uncharacterized protein YqeY